MKKMRNMLAVFLAVCLLLCMAPAATSAEGAEENVDVYIFGEYWQSKSQEAFDLINEAREAEGLPALKWDNRLEEAAMRRAVECIVRFDTSRPDNRDFFSVLDDYSIGYILATEHIAYDQPDASSLVSNFMEDEDFRVDILDEEYTHVGIGCAVYGGETYWVELFISDPALETNDPCSMNDNEFLEPVEIYGPYADVSLFTYPEALTNLAIGDQILATLLITCNFPEGKQQIFLEPNGFTWSLSNENVAQVEEGVITIIGEGVCEITIRDIETDEVYETFSVSTESSSVVIPTSPATGVVVEPTNPAGEQPTGTAEKQEEPAKEQPSTEAEAGEATAAPGSGSDENTKNPKTGTGMLLPLAVALAACSGMVLVVSRKKK